MSDQPTPHEQEKWVYEQVRDEKRRAHDRFAEFHLAPPISVLAFIAAQGRIGISQLGGIADCLILFALGGQKSGHVDPSHFGRVC
jgi:hypothetical protein